MLTEQPYPNLENFNQPKIEIVLFQPIFNKVRATRQEYFLAQVKGETLKPKHRTIEIPADEYVYCHKDYVCIPKSVYNGQPVPPSTVNAAPQANINNPNPNQPFNPNQLPNQSIQQINQNVNPSLGQINNNQNQFPPSGFNPNQGINQGGFGQQPNFGQSNGNQGTSLIWSVGVNGGWRF